MSEDHVSRAPNAGRSGKGGNLVPAQPKVFQLASDYTPLRDQVRDEIRARVVDGRYPPGFRIVERELADELGVSRLPVREALRMLQAEGFVEVLPRRGNIVKQLSRTDVEELFDVREALEMLACRRAAERADRAGLNRLQRLVDRARRAIDAGDIGRVGATNAAFHDEIINLAGNSLLSAILEPLHDRMHWLFRQYDDPERLWVEHRRLYEAIASGDADAASACAVDHVRVNRQIALWLLFDRVEQAAGDDGEDA